MNRHKLLGLLLHLANRDIPFLAKAEFYAMKTRLLKKYGTFIVEEVQHIKKDCYSCDSTGIFKSDYKPRERCWSCNGTGIYEQFWTRLEKYQLGNYSFHNPTKRQYSYEPLFEGRALPVIEGYIRHKAPKHRMGREAALWLFLFFDFKTFKRQFGHVGSPTNKRTPLVFLDNLIFRMKHTRFEDLLPKKKPSPNYVYDIDEDLPF